MYITHTYTHTTHTYDSINLKYTQLQSNISDSIILKYPTPINANKKRV